MEIVSSIGERLREEREALGKTQSEFADVAAAARVPGATRQSQAKYEKGLAAPSAAYMSAIAGAGADVLYILTGERGGVVLTAEERQLLTLFKEAPKEVRRAALGALLGAKAVAGHQVSMRDVTMNNSAPGGVQVGYVAGKVNVKKGK